MASSGGGGGGGGARAPQPPLGPALRMNKAFDLAFRLCVNQTRRMPKLKA